MSLESIPKELQLRILSLLSYSDLSSVSLACRRLKDAARDPALWRKLTLEYEWIKTNTQACRDHVSRCTSLREIVITAGEWEVRSDKIMSVVMKAKGTLSSIALYPSLSNSSLKKISKISQLTKLSFYGAQIKADGISSLANLTELRSLRIPWHGHNFWYSDIVSVNSGSVQYLEELVNLFTHLNKLEEVAIQSFFLRDQVVESLVVNNPNLQHLNINTYTTNHPNNHHSLTSRSISLIADYCHQLTHIDIGHQKCFSRTDIQKLITGCPKLKHANFERTLIDDCALEMLSHKCPELEHLSLAGCRHVSEEGVEGFITVAATAKLMYFDIRDLYATNPGFAKRVELENPNIKVVHCYIG